MFSGRAMPFVTTAIRFPPPAAALLLPNPLTACVRPSAAIHGQRRKQKGVFVAVARESPANDQTGITDRGRDRKHFEAGGRRIAKGVEIVHLPTDVKKCVLGIIGRGGGPDHHSGGISAGAGNTVGLAGGPSECSQIRYAES